MASDNRVSRHRKTSIADVQTAESTDPDTREDLILTPQEMEAAQGYISSEQIPKLKKLGTLNAVYPDHPNRAVGQALIARALGISDETFYAGALKQLINASSEGTEIDIEGLNYAVSLVRSIEPRDQLETMLAIQMASVHLTSMKHMRMLNHTQTIPQLDIQERVVNKLMRTFTSQMEALRKHRNGGNQKVVVEHVHVHEGGQAIVGNVNHGGRVSKQGGAQSHGQEDLCIPVGAAVLRHVKTDQVPMPGAGGEGQGRVPVPRRAGGSAKG